MFPKIVQVVPTEGHTVYVYFEDGKIVCYDVKPLLEKEVFAVLREIDFFIKSCMIMNDTLAWDVSGNRDSSNCIDIDPDTLYMLETVKEEIA
ncbi:DUF2442 domain-containing protein [Emergencia sp. 1XD21-10]|uniref:DUF2442 domain-containing protein n=1 Tax=Emergencia sp. 1XD21-10 TaxID=2304569 RepID=UPI0013794997|nr:DUF2442 domain-containing protein [Emergencia sp. 1XD21-10]NCE98344.1 DUF2442 domain-containing protein [Emergencia sp. 1XD21-10]